MSYTTIYAFRNGEIAESVDFQNGFGGAIAIWDSMIARHHPDGDFHMFDPDYQAAIKSYETDPAVPWYAKGALFTTYTDDDSGGEGGAVVMAEHMVKVAEAFELFTEDYARWWTDQNRVYHVDKQAKAIRRLHAKGVEAIGWQNTSAGSSVFEDVYGEETEEEGPYRLDMKLHYLPPMGAIIEGRPLTAEDLA